MRPIRLDALSADQLRQLDEPFSWGAWVR